MHNGYIILITPSLEHIILVKENTKVQTLSTLGMHSTQIDG